MSTGNILVEKEQVVQKADKQHVSKINGQGVHGTIQDVANQGVYNNKSPRIVRSYFFLDGEKG